MPSQSRSHRGAGSDLRSKLAAASNGVGRSFALGDSIECEELQAVVGIVLDAGGAVMFSKTSDGGALGVTFFLDDVRTKRYLASREEWLDLVTSLRQ